MTGCIPGKLCHILILKIWLVGLVLIIAVPCKAYNCQFCGKEILSTDTRYCLECSRSIIESPLQAGNSLADGCRCRGACNCASSVSVYTNRVSVLAGLGIVAAISSYLSYELSPIALMTLGLFLSAPLRTLKGVLYPEGNTYMLSRRQARAVMLEVNNELGQHPEEDDRINVLSDDFMALVRAAHFNWHSSKDFEELLTVIHTRWMNIWLRNTPGGRMARSLLLPDGSPYTAEGLLVAFVIDSGAYAFPSLNSILSSRVFPGLERELNVTDNYPINIGLGYLRISLYPVGQGLFDMFETSTGVYRNLTKEDVIKRIGLLCERLNVHVITIRQSMKAR